MMDDLKATLAIIRQDYEVQVNNSGQTNGTKQRICAHCFVQRFQNVQGCSQKFPRQQKYALSNMDGVVISQSAAMNSVSFRQL
jgi:hypothetical protein